MNSYNEILSEINPTLSDKALTEAVVKKTHIRNRAKVKNICITAIVAGLLAGMTITAGAISNWDYSVIARFFFGGSENVVEGMHDEIRYQINPDNDNHTNCGKSNSV